MAKKTTKTPATITAEDAKVIALKSLQVLVPFTLNPDFVDRCRSCERDVDGNPTFKGVANLEAMVKQLEMYAARYGTKYHFAHLVRAGQHVVVITHGNEVEELVGLRGATALAEELKARPSIALDFIKRSGDAVYTLVEETETELPNEG